MLVTSRQRRTVMETRLTEVSSEDELNPRPFSCCFFNYSYLFVEAYNRKFSIIYYKYIYNHNKIGH